MESRFKPGDTIKHFKRDFVSEKEKEENKYLYHVLAIAKHTETEEPMLVYQALYHPFQVFTRPLAMAEEKVDKEKYPDAVQEYRLELYNKEKDAQEKEFIVPVTWEMCGLIKVKANSPYKAFMKVKNDEEYYSLPKVQNYVDASFAPSFDTEEMIEEYTKMYENGELKGEI